MARGGTRPSRSARVGCASGKMTRRSISSFSLAMPPSCFQAPARTIWPPSWPSIPALPGSTGSSRSYKTIPRRTAYPACSSARAPISLSAASRHWIRCTPAATSRRSSSASIALPIPRCRHAAARLIRITHARSPPTVATATPASSSPATATTAGSCARTAAIRSDRLNAGASLLAAGSSHNRTAASRSSAWKSRTRHGAIASVCHHRTRAVPGGDRPGAPAHCSAQVHVKARGVGRQADGGDGLVTSPQ